MAASRLASLGARLLRALPRGAPVVGGGLLVLGVTSYGFLILSARMVGPRDYAGLAVLWALVFTVGPGLFVPLEQEVARALAARGARGEGGRPVAARAALAGAGLLGILGGTVFVAGAPLSRLLSDDVLLVFGLGVSLGAYAVQHLLRGLLAGAGRFGAYGAALALEGLARLGVCGALALAGVAAAGPYGVALGAAPLAAVLVAPWVRGQPLSSGPPAPWRELSRALGFLLAASLLAQLLVNAGPVAVRLLARPGEEAEAGRFLAGLTLARVPLFLFAAVQAALLPRLAALAAQDQRAAFLHLLARLGVLVAAVTVAAALVAGTAGPWLVEVLFGEGFRLGRLPLGLLATAAGAYMAALVMAQALIALTGHRAVALGWGAGIAVFVVATAAGSDLVLRVAVGFLAGCAAAGVTQALLLRAALARGGLGAVGHAEVGVPRLPVEP